MNSISSCTYSSGIFHPGLIVALALIVAILTVAVVMCHIMIIKLIKTGFSSSNAQPAANSSNTDTHQRKVVPNKWLSTQRSLVQMMLIVMAVFSISWWPLVLIQLVAALCDTCTVPQAMVFMMQGLLIMSYISNGFIYLAKSQDFKKACRKLLCSRCVQKVHPSDQTSVIVVK